MTKKNIKPKFLRINERKNAIDYLEKAHNYIRETEEDLMAWKWVALTLHSALYGFAVCACAGTNVDFVAPEIKNGKNKGKRELISFNKALGYCQNTSVMSRFDHSKTLKLTSDQRDSINILKELFRDNFVHFSPKHWSIELHGISHVAIDILDVIRFLAIETGNITHLSITEKKKIKSLVYQSKRILKNSAIYKEAEELNIVRSNTKP